MSAIADDKSSVPMLTAHASQLCLDGGCGVKLVRDVLRELTMLGRRHVSIVVHRM